MSEAIGMKEQELRECAVCAVCGQPFGASKLPMFWRVKLVRHGVDMRAIQRQDGLGAVLGHSGLAGVMGPDETMTKVLSSREITVCETCAGDTVTVYQLGLELS